MDKVNFTLEVINGSVAILTFFLFCFLIAYLVSDINREGFSWRTFFFMSTAASLVVALFVEKTGTFATRTVVWAWRIQGGNLPFTTVENLFLIVGAILTSIGLIMMIRVLSRPRFGNWPWIVSTIMVLDYIGVETFIHLMRW